MFLLMFCLSGLALAADFFHPETGLSLEIPEGFVEKKTSFYRASQKIPVSFSQRFEDSENRFIELFFLESNANTILEDLKIRVISDVKTTNEQLIGKTALSVQGISHQTATPLLSFIIPWDTRHLLLTGSPEIVTKLSGTLEKKSGFQDVRGHPFEIFIEEAYDFGIFKGYEESGKKLFKPDAPMRRVEFLKALLSSRPEKIRNGKATILFRDIPKNAWYFPIVEEAVQKKLVKGYPDGTFRPDHIVKLSEALTMLLRSRGLEEDLLFFVRRVILETDQDRYRFPFTLKSIGMDDACTRSCAAALLVMMRFTDQFQDQEPYSRPANREELPFLIPEEYQVRKRSAAYDLYASKNGVLSWTSTIHLSPVETWEPKESGFRLLGENSSTLFLLTSACDIEQCMKEQVQQEKNLEKEFRLKNQDLAKFSAKTFSFHFLPADVPLKRSSDVSKDIVEIESPKKTFYISFERIVGSIDEPWHWKNQVPQGEYMIGKYQWYLYTANTKAVDHTTLMTRFTEDSLMVVTVIENAQIKKSILPKVYRGMRTLRLAQ